MSRRQELAAPLHDVSRQLIRQRLAQFLPQEQRPPDTEEQPEAKDDDVTAEDAALLENALLK